jgi:hypothetical protein
MSCPSETFPIIEVLFCACHFQNNVSANSNTSFFIVFNNFKYLLVISEGALKVFKFDVQKTNLKLQNVSINIVFHQ